MKNYAILLTGDSIGKDAKELGEKLMASYLYTLAEAENEELPTHLLFVNTGVNLVKKGAPTVQSLEVLQDKGVKLLACGTCVDYFNLRDAMAIGEISNMYVIRDLMAKADKVITLG